MCRPSPRVKQRKIWMSAHFGSTRNRPGLPLSSQTNELPSSSRRSLCHASAAASARERTVSTSSSRVDERSLPRISADPARSIKCARASEEGVRSSDSSLSILRPRRLATAGTSCPSPDSSLSILRLRRSGTAVTSCPSSESLLGSLRRIARFRLGTLVSSPSLGIPSLDIRLCEMLAHVDTAGKL